MTRCARASSSRTRRPRWPSAWKIFVEHVRLNGDKGLGARLAGAALSVPGVTGLLRKGLEKDYKTNLY